MNIIKIAVTSLAQANELPSLLLLELPSSNLPYANECCHTVRLSFAISQVFSSESLAAHLCEANFYNSI
jgi:hypothetical protein